MIKVEETHKEQETFVLSDGSTAAQKAQEEQHAAYGQDDVDTSEQQWVSCYYLPEAHRIQQHPNTDTQQKGATQLQRVTCSVRVMSVLQTLTVHRIYSQTPAENVL